MKKISVAIPTYYSSNLIEETIYPLLSHKVVDEIIITDDSEDNNEYNKLSRNINNLIEGSSIKVKIFKNKKLGGFKNKYNSISKTSNDFVYQLIQQYSNNKSLKFIDISPEDTFDKEVLYIPSKIFLFKKSKYELFLSQKINCIFKKTKKITPEYLQNSFNQNINFVKDKDVMLAFKCRKPIFYKSLT